MSVDYGIRAFNNTYGFGSQISKSTHDNTVPRLVYFNGKVRGKSSFTAGYGSKSYLSNSNPIGVGSIKDFDYDNGYRGIWDPNGLYGWETRSGDVGNEHSTVVEIYDTDNNVWFPASAFGGIGMETENDKGGNHATYMTHICVSFYNGSSWRVTSQGYQGSETDGKKFFQLNDSYAETIRSWGDSWRFYGLIFRLYNSSKKVGTENTRCRLWNVKIYPWFKDMAHSGQDKWILPARRSWANLKQQNFPAASFETSLYDPT